MSRGGDKAGYAVLEVLRLAAMGEEAEEAPWLCSGGSRMEGPTASVGGVRRLQRWRQRGGPADEL